MSFFIGLPCCLTARNYDHQSVAIPTERSEGGSQSNAPLPVAGGALLFASKRDVSSRLAEQSLLCYIKYDEMRNLL